MPRAFPAGLQLRLALLIFLVTIPAFGLAVFNAVQNRRAAEERVRQEVLALSQLAGAHQEQIIENSRQLLVAIARFRSVREFDPLTCAPLLADLAAQYPHYNNFVAAKANGDVFCASHSFAAGLNLAGQNWFQRALQSKDMVFTGYQVSQTTGQPTVAFVYPVLNDRDGVELVVIAIPDMGWFNQQLSQIDLPPGAAITILDNQGAIMARNPNPELWLGRRLPEEPLVQAILSQGEGVLEVPGLDDTLRLYAFAPVGRAGPDWHTAIGIPTRAAFAPIDSQLWGSLIWLGLVAALALAAAWVFAHRFMLRPVKKLSNAAQRLAGGDLAARAGPDYGAGELGHLARSFDDMAASLEQRQTELYRANRALRMLSDCNQVLIRAKDEAGLLEEICRVIVAVGGYRLVWVGMAHADEKKTVQPVAQAGFEEGYLAALQITWADEIRGRGPTGTAIRLGQPVIAREIQTDPDFAAWRAEAIRRGYASSIALPLKSNNQVFGAFNIYAERPHAFDETEVALLTELADDLAFGIINLRARIARRRAEEQVVYQAHLLQDISDAVIATDTNFIIMSWNKAAETLYGRPAREVIGKMVGDVIPTRYVDAQAAAVLAQFQAKGVWQGEVIQQHCNGTSLNILSSVSVIKNSAGQTTGAVAVNRDITEYRRLEERVRQAQKMESIGHLAGGIAHDFNNLLMPMIGYADLSMAELPPDSKIYANLRQIRRAAERAANLTRQILAFSRKQILELKTVNLNDIIIPFEEMLRRLISEDIELLVTLNPALAAVRADASQIEQVILNLAINARDAMLTGGKLTIETDNIYLDEEYVAHHVPSRPGPYVLLTVSDTGHGMDQATLSRIFEPFFTTKEVGKGTGLGLATVFGIVKQHNGNIWAYSEPGHGTTFKVYLPAVPETAILNASETSPAEIMLGTETILLAEDDLLVREMVVDYLDTCGYRVLAAENAEAALQLAAHHGPAVHLLITDVILPGTNGANLHQAMLPYCPNLKVLFISGYTDNVIVHRGILKPGVSFLQKPFSMRKLLKKVRQVLDRPTAA